VSIEAHVISRHPGESRGPEHNKALDVPPARHEGPLRFTGFSRNDDFAVHSIRSGKTYVYLRTIFELNRRYGFAKFVIIVPSVAIKEGAYKSLQIMEEHLRVILHQRPL
jgi:hypothetical protein